MRSWPVLAAAAVVAFTAALALACGPAPAARISAPPAAGGPRRWVYQLTIPDAEDESKPGERHQLVLTESARRRVADHPVIELDASLDGQPLTADTMGGLAP